MVNEPQDYAGVANLPAAYEGERMVLRSVGRPDYPAFLRWRTELTDLHIWSSSRRVPTLEEFGTEMDTMLRQSVVLLVIAKEAAQPIGFVQAYNFNQADGWCFFAAYLAPAYRRARYGAEAFMPFVDYIFRNFNIRKIYMDVHEFNMEFLGVALQSGAFVEEGRFREHTWYDGRFWDMVRVALYRDRWASIAEWAKSVLHHEQPVAELLAELQSQRGSAHTA